MFFELSPIRGSGIILVANRINRFHEFIKGHTCLCFLNQVIDVSAGLSHTCVTVVDGSASCWGSNGSLELGDPNAGTFSASPVAVVDLLSDVRAIEAGTFSTCALGFDGLAQCWGYNNNRHLGTGEELLTEAPTLVDCLPGCSSEDNPYRYKPITAFDYITMRLSGTIDQ